MKEYAPTAAVLLDIDGTLLDSNEAHASAWIEALRRHDRPQPYQRIRPVIGKRADKVLMELFGLDTDEPQAKEIDGERKRLFLEQLPSLRPTAGARALLERMKAEGITLAIATSAGGSELSALLEQAGVADLIELAATSSDAEHSKPDPDIVRAALDKCGVDPLEAMMLGDTPYDIAAAAAAGVDTIALRCGGWWADRALAGAVAIYDDPATLLAQWQAAPIFRRASRPAESGTHRERGLPSPSLHPAKETSCWLWNTAVLIACGPSTNPTRSSNIPTTPSSR